MIEYDKETKDKIIQSAQDFIEYEFRLMIDKPSRIKKKIFINKEGINGYFEIDIKYIDNI